MSHKYLAAQAKRMVREWANNHDDPEFIVKQGDVVELTEANRERLYSAIRHTAKCLHLAFEASGYDRDWFLFSARHAWAVNTFFLGPRFATAPGVIIKPDENSVVDRLVSFVQTHLANKMTVCAKCRTHFFRPRKEKYCSKPCRNAGGNASKLKSWNKHKWGRGGPRPS
jgi:hypothetical protein